MTALTQDDLEELEAFVLKEDRAGYYSVLERAGVAYGALAASAE